MSLEVLTLPARRRDTSCVIIGLPGHPGGRKKAAMQKRDEAAKGISEIKISVDIEDADTNIIVC
jgi:hypothetical protein